MKTADTIPTGKMERAGKIIKTGLKVGKNYLNYYGEKIINPNLTQEKLDKSNAEDIMDSLKELKGSGLKVAQMLSMEENLLPQAYVEQFSLAQFSVPALSAPLVKKTFLKYFQKTPDQVFDDFDYKSRYAASIGQVHEASFEGKKLAVKIQYPGVADSIKSDLALLKPLASKILRVNLSDADKYFKEVENKLLEETDYSLELSQSIELSAACSHIDKVVFPNYYPHFSNERILTMDWIDGMHLSEFIKTNPSKEVRNELGQRIWDLFMFQIHNLKKVHADPHPGNIIITPEGNLAIIDFGCIKSVPDSFYEPYFELADKATIGSPELFEQKLYELELLYEDDKPEEKEYFYKLFKEALGQLLIPFHNNSFDFSDNTFFKEIAAMGERISKDAIKSKYKPSRGSTHFIYMNRTFFGIYNLLHILGSTIDTKVRAEVFL